MRLWGRKFTLFWAQLCSKDCTRGFGYIFTFWFSEQSCKAGNNHQLSRLPKLWNQNLNLGLLDFKAHTLSKTSYALPTASWASIMCQLLCRQLLILVSGKVRLFLDKHVSFIHNITIFILKSSFLLSKCSFIRFLFLNTTHKCRVKKKRAEKKTELHFRMVN